MIKFKHPDLIGSEPKKKIKKKPTGILKDLEILKTCYIEATIKNMFPYRPNNGIFVRWSDVEAIIKKYSC